MAVENRSVTINGAQSDTDPAPRVLTPEARRALAEAEERRKKQAAEPPAPPEVGGREGPDPTRFGDWEKGGITSDF
jgi:hypothetical protein